jgi:hypothetical protein
MRATWTDKFLNGALVACLVQWLMTSEWPAAGFGLSVGGVEIEALAAGILALLFGDKIPTWAAALKNGILSFIQRDAPVPSPRALPTAEDGKAAVTVLAARYRAVCGAKLADFRALAVDLGGAEWGAVVDATENTNDVAH